MWQRQNSPATSAQKKNINCLIVEGQEVTDPLTSISFNKLFTTIAVNIRSKIVRKNKKTHASLTNLFKIDSSWCLSDPDEVQAITNTLNSKKVTWFYSIPTKLVSV